MSFLEDGVSDYSTLDSQVVPPLLKCRLYLRSVVSASDLGSASISMSKITRRSLTFWARTIMLLSPPSHTPWTKPSGRCCRRTQVPVNLVSSTPLCAAPVSYPSVPAHPPPRPPPFRSFPPDFPLPPAGVPFLANRSRIIKWHPFSRATHSFAMRCPGLKSLRFPDGRSATPFRACTTL